MDLVHVFMASLGAWALVRFLAIPAAERRLRIDRTLGRVRLGALLAAMGAVQGVLLTVCVTTLAVTAVVVSTRWLGGGTIAQVGAAIARVQAWRGALGGFSPYWGMAMIVALVGMLILHAHRSGRRRMEEAYGRVFAAEYQRLRGLKDAGQWPSLPPNPEMERVTAQLAAARSALAALSESSRLEDEAVRNDLHQRMQQLDAYHEALDIRRRMDVSLLTDDAALPQATTLGERLQTFFISQGLLAGLGTTSRLLHISALVLLVPSLLGVAAGPYRAALDRRVAQLSELQVRLSAEQARQDWEQAKAGLASEVAELTAEDERALKTLAARFEDRVVSPSAWELPVAPVAHALSAARPAPAQVARPREPGYEYRAGAARDRILRQAAGRSDGRMERMPSMSDGPTLTGPERTATEVFERTMTADGPSTRIGERVYTEAREAARRSPSFRSKVRAAAARFQTPVRAPELGRALLGQVFSEAAASTGSESLRFAVDQFYNEPRLRPVVKTLQDSWADGFLHDIVATNASVDDALSKVGTGQAERPVITPEDFVVLKDRIRVVEDSFPHEADLGVKSREHPPSAETPPEADVDLDRAAETLDRYSHNAQGRPRVDPETASESLAGYDDYFTAQADISTPREEWVRQQTERAPGGASENSGTSRQNGSGGMSRSEQVVAAVGDSPSGGPEQPGFETGPGGGGGGGGGPGFRGNRRGSASNGSGPTPGPATSPGGGPSGNRPGGGGPRGAGGGGGGRAISSRPVHVARAGAGAARSVMPSRFVNARSFVALRGFSRVGGVLIGRPPTNGEQEASTLVDLRWEPQNATTGRVVVVDGAGKTHRSGPVRRSVAYAALLYAADGRPLAVTMVTAKPLRELKILLHPTLVDTPLGVRIIDLDRLVDTYAGVDDPRRIAAENAVGAQGALYQFAWACRILATQEVRTDELDLMFSRFPHDYYQALLKNARRIGAEPSIRKKVAAVLADRAAIADPLRSVLAGKPEYYDSSLVADIRRTAASDADGLASELDSRYRGALRKRNLESFGGRDLALFPISSEMSRQARADLIVRALKLPPEFTIWSGVREHEYAATTDALLAFDAPAEGAFDFMLQVAFTTPPEFGPKRTDAAGRAEQEERVLSDPKPWEFPFLKDHIQQRILATTARDARVRAIVADCAEFTRLQRLFRMAFEGRLGTSFPVERLAGLESVLAGGRGEKIRTPRWNTRAGDLQVAVRWEFQRVTARLDAVAGKEDMAEEWFLSAKQALASRTSLLDEYRTHLRDHTTAATRGGQTSTERDALWTQWKAWRLQWLERWKGLAPVGSGARPAAAHSVNSLAAIADQAADLERQLTSVFELREALNVARDDRQLLESAGGELPPLDP